LLHLLYTPSQTNQNLRACILKANGKPMNYRIASQAPHM